AKRGEVYGDLQGEGNIDQLPVPEDVRRINLVLGLSKAAGAKFLGRRLHEFLERVGSKRCHRGTPVLFLLEYSTPQREIGGGVVFCNVARRPNCKWYGPQYGTQGGISHLVGT